MMKRRLLIGAAALAGISGYAAADEVGQWYVAPQVGYLWADNDRNADDDMAYGLSVGKHFSEKWNFEINFNHADLDLQAPGNLSVRLDEFSANWQRLFGSNDRIRPYWTFGVGVLRTDGSGVPSADRDNGLLGQAGLGVLWQMTDRVALRTEGKARWTDSSHDATDYLALLGLRISLGSVAKAPAPLPPPPPPVRPTPPPPPPPPPPPADSDHDGVLDTSDRCPGTPAGVAVDAVGCPRKGSATLEGVTFEFNSAQLTAGSNTVLDRVAADLKKYPRLKIELQGHTDSMGKDAYNLKLSQQRAESVRDYLIGQGVPAGQLTAKGYGETKPVADNKTEEGRSQNRRVVMEVLDNPGDVQVKGEGEAKETAN